MPQLAQVPSCVVAESPRAPAPIATTSVRGDAISLGSEAAVADRPASWSNFLLLSSNSIETLPSYRRSTLYMAVGPPDHPCGMASPSWSLCPIHRSTALRRSTDPASAPSSVLAHTGSVMQQVRSMPNIWHGRTCSIFSEYIADMQAGPRAFPLFKDFKYFSVISDRRYACKRSRDRERKATKLFRYA
jgi:hypothetical protein